MLTAGEVVVDADVPEILVGIDGETVMMSLLGHIGFCVDRDRP